MTIIGIILFTSAISDSIGGSGGKEDLTWIPRAVLAVLGAIILAIIFIYRREKVNQRRRDLPRTRPVVKPIDWTPDQPTVPFKNPNREPKRDNTSQIRTVKQLVDEVKPEEKPNRIKYIGYSPSEDWKQKPPYSYCIVKMPKSGSVIKFPRRGRASRKGWTEEGFKLHLIKYFTTDFEILNDRHIPTRNKLVAYEPDFSLLNERKGKNIFIDIEIDEPYEGISRAPSHCTGDDEYRDQFFISRGWIVIRFAEIQVHQQPKECCALISQVIRSIDKDYKVPPELSINQGTKQVPQWSSLQAKKWAKENYRESYLGTNFGIANEGQDYQIEITDLDNEIEDLVIEEVKPPARVGIKDKLESQNKVQRDSRIQFDPVNHRYFIDGNADTISVSQLVSKFFPEFDAGHWAPIKASQRGISTAEIINEWESKRVNSANLGTNLHVQIENYYNDKPYNKDVTEFKYFLDFTAKYPSLSPFRTEWRIFDEEMMIAGTVDMVYRKESGDLFMFDWKRSEKVIFPDGKIKNDSWAFGSGGLSHLGDNSFNRYSLQQNIYRYILEKRYGKIISSMNLLILHPDYETFHLKQVPKMDREVEYIFKTTKERKR